MADKQKGRPSDFTQEMADFICEALSEGKSLRKICEPEDMPNRAAVFRWLSKNEDFRNQYAYAREEQAEALADDILAIADQYDQTLEKLEGGTDHIQRAKLRIDSRKWVASKLKPKKYGDKVQNEITGDLNVQVSKIEHTIVDPNATDTDS